MFLAACGGDDDDDGGGGGEASRSSSASSRTARGIRPFYEPDIAGAHVPFINRGATANNGEAQRRHRGAEIAGHPIEIVGYGCGDETLRAGRRDASPDGAGGRGHPDRPAVGDEGIAIANYAKEHQDKTFINGTSGAQDTTLKVQAPNFFRFHTDGAQWSAGAGDYAYNELGWRRAATIGDDYSFPHTSVGGFIAEFCAVGGQVAERIWPALVRPTIRRSSPRSPTTSTVSTSASAARDWWLRPPVQPAEGAFQEGEFIGNLFVDDPLVLKEIGTG